jgi:hypothetical protein
MMVARRTKCFVSIWEAQNLKPCEILAISQTAIDIWAPFLILSYVMMLRKKITTTPFFQIQRQLSDQSMAAVGSKNTDHG